jgi:hypothetical protein
VARAPDAFDMDDALEFPEEREVRCRYCEERDLYWSEDIDGKFVLVNEEGEKHKCSAFNPPVDISELEEFDDE